MTYLNLTKCRILEEWVEIILTRFECTTQNSIYLPIPVKSIAEDLFGLRLDKEQLKGKFQSASGFIILERNQIIVNAEDNSKRISFTIAHELAHYLIDHPNRNGENIKVFNSSLPHLLFDHEKEKESIANYFAAALLIPRRELIKVINRRPWLYSYDLPGLADLFCTSIETLKIRLEDLRIDLAKLGTQLQLYAGFERKSEVRLRNSATNKQNHIADCIVDVDFDFIDYHLIRKLQELKERSNNLYILCTNANINLVDTLFDFSTIDGVALAEPNIIMANNHVTENIDFSYLKIVKDKWLGWIQEKFLPGQSNTLTILTRSNDGRLDQRQQYLISLNDIINPKLALNGRAEAAKFIKEQKRAGKRVVIVTGCFDLITNAHIKFLKRAKAQGDTLVVGIEDDNRVKAFKGPSRPINFIHQRVEVIEALGGIVDFVFVIRGSTKDPIKKFYTRLHCELKADILAVSEGDPHKADRIDEIEAAGGVLVTVSKFEEGSTTSLLRKALAELPEFNEFILINKRMLTIRPPAHEWTQLNLFK